VRERKNEVGADQVSLIINADPEKAGEQPILIQREGGWENTTRKGEKEGRAGGLGWRHRVCSTINRSGKARVKGHRRKGEQAGNRREEGKDVGDRSERRGGNGDKEGGKKAEK